jgi:uncharacterized protein (TIGR03435 family)
MQPPRLAKSSLHALSLIPAIWLSGLLQPQPLAAQSAAPLTFDVISVKPNSSAGANGNINRRDDGIHIENFDLSTLIRFAFNLDFDGQMIGIPAWTRAAHFDIDARVAAEDVASFKKLSSTQIDDMLVKILEARFNIAVHREERQLPIYRLVLSKNGAKPEAVKPSKTAQTDYFLNANDVHISLHNEPISALAAALTRRTRRTVVDQTGLPGNYDLDLKFSPFNADPDAVVEEEARIDAGAPDLFTALQEQLGFKLESGKGTVSCIVLDRIERPSVD